MTKAELSEIIYNVHGGLSKKEAYKSVDQIFSIMKNKLLAGEEIRVSGFGTFAVTQKVERVGRNPQTGDKITISPRKSINFKAARSFKDHLNE